jgi:hypothetical protein
LTFRSCHNIFWSPNISTWINSKFNYVSEFPSCMEMILLQLWNNKGSKMCKKICKSCCSTSSHTYCRIYISFSIHFKDQLLIWRWFEIGRNMSLYVINRMYLWNFIDFCVINNRTEWHSLKKKCRLNWKIYVACNFHFHFVDTCQ